MSDWYCLSPLEKNSILPWLPLRITRSDQHCWSDDFGFSIRSSSVCDCTCGKSYVGETKKKIIIWSLEHCNDTLKGNLDKTCVTQYSKICNGRRNWLNPIIYLLLLTLQILQKERRFYPTNIMEALKIRLLSQNGRWIFHDWRRRELGLKRQW